MQWLGRLRGGACSDGESARDGSWHCKAVRRMELITVSVAMSIDGYIGDHSPERLMLSSAEDQADMYRERAEHDAILIGAETLRRDNPSLLLKDANSIAKRVGEGRSPHPMRVTVTRSGELEASSRFFVGPARSIVLCASSVGGVLAARLGAGGEVVLLDSFEPRAIVNALKTLGMQSLFIEGGSQLLTVFLAAGMFHRLRLAIAPFFVGDARSPRLVNPERFVNDKNHRLQLLGVRALGDTSVLDFQNDEFSRELG